MAKRIAGYIVSNRDTQNIIGSGKTKAEAWAAAGEDCDYDPDAILKMFPATAPLLRHFEECGHGACWEGGDPAKGGVADMA